MSSKFASEKTLTNHNNNFHLNKTANTSDVINEKNEMCNENEIIQDYKMTEI